jgi:cytochrome c biogenesis protein CcmG/thiol:disulfide interchange protein DsbE
MSRDVRHILSTTVKGVFLLWLLASLCTPAQAAQIKLDSMQVGSRVYTKVVVLGFNATDVYFTHSRGISNERLKRLDPELQKMFSYDETAAANAERQQAEDNAEFNKQLVVTIESNARKAYETKRRADSTYAESLSDPLTQKSPIGIPLPEMKIEKWDGEKPDTKEKFQLIYVWAGWSRASGKFMPDINLLAEKFTKEISVYGVTADAAPKSDEDPVRPEFPNGIDPADKFAADLSITHLPQVVLADPKGVIRYVGHPAALTEKRVRELIKKFSAD